MSWKGVTFILTEYKNMRLGARLIEYVQSYCHFISDCIGWLLLIQQQYYLQRDMQSSNSFLKSEDVF